MSFLGDRARGVPEGGIFITKIKHIDTNAKSKENEHVRVIMMTLTRLDSSAKNLAKILLK